MPYGSVATALTGLALLVGAPASAADKKAREDPY
jgi:hypothetical protein